MDVVCGEGVLVLGDVFEVIDLFDGLLLWCYGGNWVRYFKFL